MLIAHTTDLTSEDAFAFVHALALSIPSGARLVSVHACVGPEVERELPTASVHLERWGAVASFEYECLLHTCCDDVADTLLDALTRLRPDLVVTATHARSGVKRLVSGSIAEGVARNLSVPTLLLPLGGTSFVDDRTGAIRLTRILVAGGQHDEVRRGIGAAIWFRDLAGAKNAEIVVIHAGDGALEFQALAAQFSVVLRLAKAPMETAIAAAARELEPALIVMTTHGHDGLRDVLLGSTTERVLHRTRSPLLWVPLAQNPKH